MGNQKFYQCGICGNLIGIIDNTGVPVVCCGEEMTELVPNTFEGASTEKHLPVAVLSGNTLQVSLGSAAHPMEEKHYIKFVYVQTQRGGQRKGLNPGEAPQLSFSFIDDKPVAVFAYCNIHGLWKTEIK